MAYSEPARTAPRRARSTVLGALIALVLLATPVAAERYLLGGSDRASGGAGSTYLSPHAWPPQGQAAIALGDSRPAVSPHQQPAAIASLAKVMTAYLVLQRHPLSGGRDGFTLTVTAAQERAEAEAAAEGQSVVEVKAGERLTERQLLEALLIPSGNNVAAILAEQLAGTEDRFVATMNAEAGALGMDDTTYTDPSGFDPGTVSTAVDQLRVLRRAMRFPAFRQVVSTAGVTLPVAGTITNFNPLLAEGFAGKTGSDAAAGGCLAFFTHVRVDGGRTIAAGVVMGQGEGSDTAAILADAGEAAKHLVDAVGPAE